MGGGGLQGLKGFIRVSMEVSEGCRAISPLIIS